MPFVLDASVALTWCFDDEKSELGDRVLGLLRDDMAYVPPIWSLEVANALLVGERRGRALPSQTAEAAGILGELPIQTSELTIGQALGPVRALARAHNITAYDAAYLELAMRLGLPLASTDGLLRSIATRLGLILLQ